MAGFLQFLHRQGKRSRAQGSEGLREDRNRDLLSQLAHLKGQQASDGVVMAAGLGGAVRGGGGVGHHLAKAPILALDGKLLLAGAQVGLVGQHREAITKAGAVDQRGWSG